MMKNVTSTITAGALMAALAVGAAQAQNATTPSGNTGTGLELNTTTNTPVGTGTVDTRTETRTPAVATPDSRNPNAPVAGSNSFTQSQVMTRLSRAGYTSIGNLQKGSDGIWRGTGVKDGTTHNVMFDYQGNITTGVR